VRSMPDQLLPDNRAVTDVFPARRGSEQLERPSAHSCGAKACTNTKNGGFRRHGGQRRVGLCHLNGEPSSLHFALDCPLAATQAARWRGKTRRRSNRRSPLHRCAGGGQGHLRRRAEKMKPILCSLHSGFRSFDSDCFSNAPLGFRVFAFQRLVP